MTETHQPAGEITGQELPPEIAAVVTAWRNKTQEIAAIDADLAGKDRRIAELTATLQDLNAAHAALGRERTELVRSAARLWAMAERGCQYEGLQLPPAGVLSATGASGTLAIPASRTGDPAPLSSTGTDPASKIEDALNSGPMAVLGDPAATRADDPAGGDGPSTGRFHRGNGRGR